MKRKVCGRRQRAIAAILFMFSAAPMSATADTTLRILEWEGYISPYTSEFEAYAKSKGVDVRLEFVEPFISGPDDIFESVRAGLSDIVTPTNNYFKSDDEKLLRLLTPIDTQKIGRYNKITRALREADYDRRNGLKYSVPLVGGSYGLAYNAARVDAPESWEVLWDPDNRSRVSVTDAQIEANFYIALLVDGVDPSQLYDYFDLSGGRPDRRRLEGRIRDLRANTRHYWRAIAGDFGGGVDAGIMDEMDYTTTYWFVVNEMRARGGDWRMAMPREGQTIWLDTIAIAKPVRDDAEKWAAAHLLIDFMLMDEQQRAIYERWGNVIVNDDVAREVGVDQFYADTRYLWRPLSTRTRNYFNNVWRRFE